MNGNRKYYQIAIVTFEVEDFDGDDLVEGNAESAVNGSANALSNLFIKKVMFGSDRVLLLFGLFLLVLHGDLVFVWIGLRGKKKKKKKR